MGSTIGTTCSTYMLSFTLSKLGSSFSLVLSYVIVVSTLLHLHPQFHINKFILLESTTCDLKVVIDFFLNGEVIGLGLNMSLGVGDFVRIFNRQDGCTSKGDVVVDNVGLLFFKNCSLIIGSSETYYC